MMKKFSLLIFAAVIFFFATVHAEEALPVLSADSAILVEASTGRVLYEKNADVVRQPASLTKMMTCILALEMLSPDSEIVVSQTAANTEYPTLPLAAHDIVNAEKFLTGMMLVSDNGAAVAFAENISGNVPDFTVLMNDKAREIGCESTHFANPNGLPNHSNVSTARDLAKIAMYGMRNEKFREIVGTKEMMLYWISPAGKSELCENTNELLYKDEKTTIKLPYNPAEITGIKTGYTSAAGGCLVASAKRGDVELIAVILHSATMDTRFDDAIKMLDYGFENVKMTRQIVKERVEKMAFVRGGTRATVHISPSEDLVFPLLSGEEPKNLSVTYEIPKFVDAGIERGQVIGQAVLKYKGKPVASVPMVARESVAEGFSLTSTIVSLTEPIFNAVFA